MTNIIFEHFFILFQSCFLNVRHLCFIWRLMKTSKINFLVFRMKVYFICSRFISVCLINTRTDSNLTELFPKAFDSVTGLQFRHSTHLHVWIYALLRSTVYFYLYTQNENECEMCAREFNERSQAAASAAIAPANSKWKRKGWIARSVYNTHTKRKNNVFSPKCPK